MARQNKSERKLCEILSIRHKPKTRNVSKFLVRLHGEYSTSLSFLYVCMVNTIYSFSFVEAPRKFIIAIINLRGASTKLNK